MNPIPFILFAISLPLLLGGCGVEDFSSYDPELIIVEKQFGYIGETGGRYTGIQNKFNENGEKIGEYTYYKGELIYIKTWNENGEVTADYPQSLIDGSPPSEIDETHEEFKSKLDEGTKDNPLTIAVRNGNIDAVRRHLNDGVDVNIGNPLNIAIEAKYEGRVEIVKLLLAKGADINLENKRGWTPAESLKRTAGAMMLFGATDTQEAENTEIASILIQYGLKTDVDFESWFPSSQNITKEKEKDKLSNSRLNGKVFMDYKNGQKKIEQNYKDGKLDGLQLLWYENGEKRGELNYKDGKKDGLETQWHENGQKTREANFKDDKKISEKFWNSKGEPVDSREEAEAE